MTNEAATHIGLVAAPIQATRRQWLITLVVVGAAAALYFTAIAMLGVNFPWWDDYNGVLEPCLQLKAAPTLTAKVRILFAQHNEHRIVFGKAVAYTLSALTGTLDLRHVALLGSVGLLALCAVLMVGAGRSGIPPALLAVIPLFILSPLHGHHSLWAMPSLSNYWVMAFAACSLLLVTGKSQSTKPFVAACVLAIAATLTSGQGIICFAAGSLALLYQRRWVKLGAWMAVLLLVAALYFAGYARPAHHPPLEVSLRAAVYILTITGSAISELGRRLLHQFLNLFAGGEMALTVFRAACGAGLVGAAILLWVKQYYRINLFLSVFCAYLLMLCGAAGLSRSGFGLQQANDAHYYVISGSLAICLVVAWFDCFKKPRATSHVPLAFGVAASLLCWYLFYPDMKGFSGALNESRQLFISRQDERAVLWGFRNEMQKEGARILWAGYLSGLMRFDDLREPVIQPALLEKVGSRRWSGSPSDIPALKPVATLEWSGEVLRLRPTTVFPDPSRGFGVVYSGGGKVEYVLPAKVFR